MLKEGIHTEWPDGYTVPRKENWVWRLEKWALRTCPDGADLNEEFNSHMESEGFAVVPKNQAVYVKVSWDRQDFVTAGGFWVDNVLGIGFREDLNVLGDGVGANYGVTGLGEV